ncbi:Rieske (2Fe-2S) protein [Streptomyces albofaciens JCM 4342]|uniref:Rieske (2Fe-2S) protein n=1 Tax=Streptomyces albofaciens TaxID=66866 RepID=UPI0012396167|nr:Rieske (2Fe-2S) protein [Streptomyces albofaciens]KAA6223353.1 Rieske (2Fe-2S) protein [Streptomyces albofaciens JCM 4342]
MTQQAATGRTDAVTGRRTVVAAVGAAGLAAALAACGNGSDGYGADGSGDGASSAPSGSETGSAAGSDGAGGGASKGGDASGDVLAKTADIPEGGGKVFKDRKVVVTQPAAGEFKAFSAVCRHQGCLVDEVANGTINCPCHGSKYAIDDGSVRNGPATQGLSAAKVSVAGGTIKLV